MICREKEIWSDQNSGTRVSSDTVATCKNLSNCVEWILVWIAGTRPFNNLFSRRSNTGPVSAWNVRGGVLLFSGHQEEINALDDVRGCFEKFHDFCWIEGALRLAKLMFSGLRTTDLICSCRCHNLGAVYNLVMPVKTVIRQNIVCVIEVGGVLDRYFIYKYFLPLSQMRCQFQRESSAIARQTWRSCDHQSHTEPIIATLHIGYSCMTSLLNFIYSNFSSLGYL